MSPYVAEIIHSQTPDCDTDCKGKLAEDVAKGNAVVSAHLAGTVGLDILPKGGSGNSCHRWRSQYCNTICHDS